MKSEMAYSSKLSLGRLCLLIGLCFVLSGCVGAVAGVGVAAVAAGTTEKGLGQTINDSVIYTKLSQIYFDDDVNLFSSVKVTVTQGSVLLTGAVEHPEDRVKMVQLAWQVHGVNEVINEVEVADKSSLKDAAKDKLAEAQLRGWLIADRDISSLNYHVDVVNGVVYLSGLSPSEDEMNAVVEHARNLRGATSVVNYIRVNDDRRQ